MLTISGTSFRGEGQNLVFPWQLPLEASLVELCAGSGRPAWQRTARDVHDCANAVRNGRRLDRLGGFRLLGRHSQGSLTVRPDRRQFLRNAALGAVGSVLALLGAATGLLLWPNKTGAFGSKLTVRGERCAAGRWARRSEIFRASST